MGLPEESLAFELSIDLAAKLQLQFHHREFPSHAERVVKLALLGTVLVQNDVNGVANICFELRLVVLNNLLHDGQTPPAKQQEQKTFVADGFPPPLNYIRSI